MTGDLGIQIAPGRAMLEHGVDSVHHLFGPGASYGPDPSKTWTELFDESDLWAHGVLLGADDRTDGTAVENVTWARIKASLLRTNPSRTHRLTRRFPNPSTPARNSGWSAFVEFFSSTLHYAAAPATTHPAPKP